MASRPQTPRDGVAWITGAGTGIGKAVVLELVSRGWRVAVTGRTDSVLAELAALAPGQIIVMPGDVTDAAAMAIIVETIERDHGPVALAFLNAGMATYISAPEIDLAAVRRIYDVNVMGAFNCLAALFPRMAKRAGGQIAVCASTAGYGGLPRAAAYSSTKAALINAMTAFRFDGERLGILVQVVNPGFVDTPMTKTNDFPMPFMITPDVAAKACVDGFERRGFEIIFPKRLAYILKFANLLPYPAYFWLISKVTGAGK